MMYWIVFALFTSVETISDVFLSWFPFYYEIKIIFLLWLLSPATKGSSLLYRKFVHPQLLRRENKIDEMIVAAQTRSYDTAVQLGQKSVRYVTALIMEQAVRAPAVMQDLISGQQDLTAPAATPRYQPATIREIHEEEEQTEARPQIELSDDEMADQTPAGHSGDSVDSVMMELSAGSEEAGTTSTSGTTRRGRRKKVPIDLTFSSGARTDGRSSSSYSLFLQEESRTTRSLSQSQLKNQRKPWAEKPQPEHQEPLGKPKTNQMNSHFKESTFRK